MQAKSDTVANRSRTDVAIHSRSGRLPSVQAVIFCWKEHEQRALHLERKLGTFLSVTVINSDTSARERQPHWVHLDDSAYFSEQWNSSVDPRGLLPAADQGQSTADTKELDHILAMHFGWWDVFVGKKKPMSATSPMTTANDSTSTATSLDLTGSFLNGSDSTQ